MEAETAECAQLEAYFAGDKNYTQLIRPVKGENTVLSRELARNGVSLDLYAHEDVHPSFTGSFNPVFGFYHYLADGRGRRYVVRASRIWETFPRNWSTSDFESALRSPTHCKCHHRAKID